MSIMNKPDTFILGCTALHHAARNGHLVLVKWLIQDADVNLLPSSQKERTPMMFAKRNGHRNVALFLAEMGEERSDYLLGHIFWGGWDNKHVSDTFDDSKHI